YLSAKVSYPFAKLTIQPERLILADMFREFHLDASRVIRLHDYRWPLWFWVQGIRIEHRDENCPSLLIFWTLHLAEIKASLIENGFQVPPRSAASLPQATGKLLPFYIVMGVSGSGK